MPTLYRVLDLTKLDENQLEFKKEANILRQIEKTLQHSTLTHILGLIIIQTTVITPLQGLSSLI